jgi:hypothetical protein
MDTCAKIGVHKDKDKKYNHGSACADRRVQGRDHSQGMARMEGRKIKRAKRRSARGRLQEQRIHGVECIEVAGSMGVKEGIAWKGMRGGASKKRNARKMCEYNTIHTRIIWEGHRSFV